MTTEDHRTANCALCLHASVFAHQGRKTSSPRLRVRCARGRWLSPAGTPTTCSLHRVLGRREACPVFRSMLDDGESEAAALADLQATLPDCFSLCRTDAVPRPLGETVARWAGRSGR